MSFLKNVMPVRSPSYTVIDSDLKDFPTGMPNLTINNFTKGHTIFRLVVGIILLIVAVKCYSLMPTEKLLSKAHKSYEYVNYIRLILCIVFFIINIYLMIMSIKNKQKMKAEGMIYLGNLKINDLSVEFTDRENKIFTIANDQGNASIQPNNSSSLRYIKLFL